MWLIAPISQLYVSKGDHPQECGWASPKQVEALIFVYLCVLLSLKGSARQHWVGRVVVVVVNLAAGETKGAQGFPLYWLHTHPCTSQGLQNLTV